jgi:HAD superfamily hydrolase (TIGR01509 family)
MLKVVFFDLGNVIVRVNIPAVTARIAHDFCIPQTMVLEPSLLELEKRFEKGYLSIEEHLTAVKKIYNFNGQIGVPELEAIWQVAFELNPAVWQIVQEIRRRVPVYLLSNTNALHIRAIRGKYDIFDNLDGLVLSYEAHAVKPEPEIYEYALRKAGVVCDEALFIDDLPENVTGAELCGIRAHRFSDVNGLKLFLRDNGLAQ